jgi:hypothetical protein
LEITTSCGAIVMRKRSARRGRRPIGKIVAQIKPASYRRRTKDLANDGLVGKELW